MRRLVVAAGVAAVAAAAASAVAQPARRGERAPVERVAVLAVHLAGDATPELARPLARSLGDGLAATGVEVLAHDDAAALLEGNPELADCTSNACLERIGELCGTDHVLTARVDARGADYTITIELFASRGRPALIDRIEETCPVCTVSDLGRRAAATAAALVRRSAEQVEVVVASSPAGARLFIDGASVGLAPLATRLPVGQHELRAELGDHGAARRTIAVAAGADGPQRFELVLAPAADDRRRIGGWSWVAAGGALVGVGVGVTLIKLEGRGTCDAEGECSRLYDTGVAGWATVGASAALGAVAGWMIYRDRRAERATRLAITPRSVGVAVRF